jgi:hypothetical protein
MSLAEMLSDLPTHCAFGTKRNAKERRAAGRPFCAVCARRPQIHRLMATTVDAAARPS